MERTRGVKMSRRNLIALGNEVSEQNDATAQSAADSRVMTESSRSSKHNKWSEVQTRLAREARRMVKRAKQDRKESKMAFNGSFAKHV